MPAVCTINELQARAARTLVDHYPKLDYPGTCHCGDGYSFDPRTTRAQHTAVKPFRVTPKEVTRC